MPTHNGNPVFRPASGANAGRGDNAHYKGTGPVAGADGQAMGGSWSDPEWQQSVQKSAPLGGTPQQTSQIMADQHTVAHADGFVGPRIGEAYGSYHDPVDQGSMSGMAPTLQGGAQRSPAGSRIPHNYNSNSGTGDRMAHMDNVVPETKPRMMQHKQTGNIIEVQKMHSGDQVNDFGTSANGRSMEPRNDVNMNPGGRRYGAGIDHTSEDYTDVSETVRSTQTYKEGRNGR